MYKTPIVEDDDFEASVEVVEGLIFLHLDVYNFNKSVLKHLRYCFDVLCEEAADQDHYSLFAALENEKFVRLIGRPYEVIEEVEYNGKNLKVVAWAIQ